MFEQLTPAIRGLVLDMDGVLWKDMSTIGDLARVFGRMHAAGLKVTLATNNATMTVDQYLKKLAGFGVALEPWQIVTSSHGVAATLSKEFPEKGLVFVVGEAGVIDALCEAGFQTITDPEDGTPVVAVVGSMDRALSYRKLSRAMTHLRAGARFYGTNPDATFPTPAGLVPGAGSMIAAIQTASGVAPVIIGKPSPFMFQLCAERMGLPMNEILSVGDRLETDVAGGQAVGARTAVVLSGVSTREQVAAWKPQPDIIAPDLTALVGA
ncbi:MAG: HAD-IIA family hydrolase [Anaerolineae bacterium]